jgi:hypothetical protein
MTKDMKDYKITEYLNYIFFIYDPKNDIKEKNDFLKKLMCEITRIYDFRYGTGIVLIISPGGFKEFIEIKVNDNNK